MEIKTTTTKIFYRIEAKPEGGFRAVPQDSTLETIEGSTREEVEEKIRAKLSETIATQLPTTFKIGGKNLTLAINTKFNLTTEGQSRPATTGSETKLTPEAGPITPGDSSGSSLRVFASLLALATLIYFLLRLFHH
jgi:hypothetical protein